MSSEDLRGQLAELEGMIAELRRIEQQLSERSKNIHPAARPAHEALVDKFRKENDTKIDQTRRFIALVEKSIEDDEA